MKEFFEEFAYYLSFDFVRFAIVAGVLIALCCALLGVSLVLKNYSMIGDGLSHVAFGSMSIAVVINVVDMYVMLPVTIVVAILLLSLQNSKKFKGDSAIAMLSVGALAIGYFLVNIFSVSANVSGDICGSLFGSTSILTLSSFDVWLCVALAIVVIVYFILFHNRIFAITFDETFLKASGIKTKTYNLIFSVIVGIVIVLAMKLVGSLLISALIVFPTVSAMAIGKSYKRVVAFSCVFSVLSALIGLVVSIMAGTPVGASIVIVSIFVYAFCYLLSFVFKK